MNFFFLLLLVFFGGVAAYSVYAANRGNEYSPAHVGLDLVDEAKDIGDIVIGLLFSVVGATFGALLKLLFGRWGSRGIFLGQAGICFILGGFMLWLGLVFA